MAKTSSYKLIAENRRARHDYEVLETLEAGIILTGSEVKSLRVGKASIVESHAAEKAGTLFLLNATIQEYAAAAVFGHEPKRPRKLLLKHREINKLIGSITRKGMTLVPLSIYFNERGRVKVSLGLAKGKTGADKRHSAQERDWKRDKQRLLKERG